MKDEKLLRAYGLYYSILEDMVKRTAKCLPNGRLVRCLIRLGDVIGRELERRSVREEYFDSYYLTLKRYGA